MLFFSDRMVSLSTPLTKSRDEILSEGYKPEWGNSDVAFAIIELYWGNPLRFPETECVFLGEDPIPKGAVPPLLSLIWEEAETATCGYSHFRETVNPPDKG